MTRRALLLVILLPAIAGGKPGVPPPMHHTTGTFEVQITPEAQVAAPAEGVPTSRMGLAKTFSGGLVGTAVGTMIAAGVPQLGSAAAYVALDQFRGSVDGHKGGFILVHRGTMTKAGAADLQVIVAPDSGTGKLVGIAGELTIRVEGGMHFYDFAYTMPASR